MLLRVGLLEHTIHLQRDSSWPLEAAPFRMEELMELNEMMEDVDTQVHWCIENLSDLEHRAFLVLGAAPALNLCEEAIHRTHEAQDLAERMLEPDAILKVGAEGPFSLNLQLTQVIDGLRREVSSKDEGVQVLKEALEVRACERINECMDGQRASEALTSPRR